MMNKHFRQKHTIRKFLDMKFMKFIIIGIGNTIFSAFIMFFLYNLLNLGYWGSSSISYILGSILSFILNKKFTFRNKDSILKTGFKFTINILICYLIAYGLAKSIMTHYLTNVFLNTKVAEQISMLLGMILFTLLNYIGQRFFAFKESNK